MNCARSSIKCSLSSTGETWLVNLDPPENIYIFGEFHRGKAGEILPGLLAP